VMDDKVLKCLFRNCFKPSLLPEEDFMRVI
jgi:hypothetical protein